jgi:hypothetical protein
MEQGRLLNCRAGHYRDRGTATARRGTGRGGPADARGARDRRSGGDLEPSAERASGAGPRSPFEGRYVCGDYNSKRVWGLRQSERKLTGVWQLCTSPESIASFGRDEAGAMYLVGYEGTIYRLDFSNASPETAGH